MSQPACCMGLTIYVVRNFICTQRYSIFFVRQNDVFAFLWYGHIRDFIYVHF